MRDRGIDDNFSLFVRGIGAAAPPASDPARGRGTEARKRALAARSILSQWREL